MALIGIKGFNGMKPIVNPILLDQGEAQLAQNVKLISGAISALKGSTTLKSCSAQSDTIYRYGTSATETNYWLEWQGDVDVIRSPIAQDQYDRLYWTDGVYAKYAPNSAILSGGGSYPGASYRLGVPKPGGAPSISAFTAPPTYTKVTRLYVMTYYNPTTGKESSASAPLSVTAVDSYKVTLALPTSNNGDSGITRKRLYRQVSGTYRRLTEIDIGVSTYDDTATDASLAAATALTAGVESRPAAPTIAPVAAAGSVSLTGTAISRQYIYTVKNVSEVVSEQTNYYTESTGSNVVTVTVDETQSVTISGMATTGVTSTGSVFRVYRKDSTDSVFRFIGESTTSSFVDVIANNPEATALPIYAPDAPASIKPSSNPTASASASTAVTTTVKRVYVVTYVDGAGNESSPSPASNAVDVVNGTTTVTVRHTQTAASGVVKRRLYRQTVTVSGASITINDANYKLVAENTSSSTAFTDNVADNALGATLSASLQGLPAAPTTAISATADIPAPVIPESRTYVYTFVSAYGEEGPPSNASAVTNIDPSGAVTVLLPSTSGGAGPYNLDRKRIYRSSTVGNQARFQFVAEIAIGTTSYVDSVTQANLGEVLPSEDWEPPPDGLKGMRLMANGVAVGFVGNTVWLSEPYLPHAWPHSYPVDAEIVGLGTFGQTVVVMTKSFPYVLQGVDPAAMSTAKLELRQSCASKRSIVETGEGVMYASPDGLVSIGNGISVITQNILSRDQWQFYNPDTMKAYLHNGRWHGFYSDDNNTRGLLVFDFTGQGAYMTVSNVGQSSEIKAGFQDASTDILYLATGGNIVRFDAGSPLTYLWRSKLFRAPQHVNFSVAQVRASAYPVTLRVYADGVLKLTKSVASGDHFRLPSGFRALDWYVEIEGTSDVSEFYMATSVAELMAV